MGIREKVSLTGQKFGRLLVLNRNFDDRPRTDIYYDCRCDCGNNVTVRKRKLSSKETQSCGCIKIEKAKINIEKNINKLRRANSENYKKKRVIEKCPIIPKLITVQVTDYLTNETYHILKTNIMSMEERHKDNKHYYTSIYLFPMSPSGKREYRVKQTINEINGMLVQIAA